MKTRTSGNALTALIAVASISSAWAQGATQRPGGSLLVPVIRVGDAPRAAMLPAGIRPLAVPAGLLPGGVSLSVAPAAGPAAVLGQLQTAAQEVTRAEQSGQTQEVSSQLSALYGERGQADGGNGGIISIDMHYSILKQRIAERGVKAEVSLQSARGQRGGGTWFVVELANTKDFTKIEDLFGNVDGEWTYQQIPVHFSIAGNQSVPNKEYSNFEPTYIREDARNNAILLEGYLGALQVTITNDPTKQGEARFSYVAGPFQGFLSKANLLGLRVALWPYTLGHMSNPQAALYLKLRNRITKMYAAVKPSKQSSALPWPLELIDSFVQKYGDAIWDVPGVMEVKTGRVGTDGLAFLVITVADVNDIAQVRKAVETQVPDVLLLHGVFGAPNQLIYEYGSAVSILPAPPHRDPAIIKQELETLKGSLIGPLKHSQVPHQGFLVDTIAIDEAGAMPRLVITFRGSLDQLQDYVNKLHREIVLKGLPVEYVRSIAG